jgi:hypothetical protein
VPRVKMTPTVRFALYFLSVYIVLLLVLLAYRFIRSF